MLDELTDMICRYIFRRNPTDGHATRAPPNSTLAGARRLQDADGDRLEVLYEIDNEKLKNLYSKAKQNQWDAEQQLDWSIEIDPSKPIVGEDRFLFLRMPFVQTLSKSQRETFTRTRDLRSSCRSSCTASRAR